MSSRVRKFFTCVFPEDDGPTISVNWPSRSPPPRSISILVIMKPQSPSFTKTSKLHIRLLTISAKNKCFGFKIPFISSGKEMLILHSILNQLHSIQPRPALTVYDGENLRDSLISHFRVSSITMRSGNHLHIDFRRYKERVHRHQSLITDKRHRRINVATIKCMGLTREKLYIIISKKKFKPFYIAQCRLGYKQLSLEHLDTSKTDTSMKYEPWDNAKSIILRSQPLLMIYGILKIRSTENCPVSDYFRFSKAYIEKWWTKFNTACHASKVQKFHEVEPLSAPLTLPQLQQTKVTWRNHGQENLPLHKKTFVRYPCQSRLLFGNYIRKL